VCTWVYADSHSLSYFISKAQQLPLADEMMRNLSKNMAMSGNIRPTDTAAVLAPNKQGNMAVFPMVLGFTHEANGFFPCVSRSALISCPNTVMLPKESLVFSDEKCYNREKLKKRRVVS
jgi:hypothetical protein